MTDRRAASPSPDPAAIAERLVRAHAERRRYAPFAAADGIATLAAAYDVQQAYVERQAAARGAGRAGYKIGLTTPAMQAMCGIATPVAGVALDDRVHGSGVELARGEAVRLGLEFEIAMRIGRELPRSDRPFERADLEAVVDAVAPAIEIVDDRGCDYATLDVLSLVADNAWHAGIVLGAWRRTWPALDGVVGEVRVDGRVVDRGCGRDVLGDPWRPLVWLANHLAGRGERLRAGDVVMTGSLVTTKFPDAPGRYRFDVDGLGAVEATLRD